MQQAVPSTNQINCKVYYDHLEIGCAKFSVCVRTAHFPLSSNLTVACG